MPKPTLAALTVVALTLPLAASADARATERRLSAPVRGAELPIGQIQAVLRPSDIDMPPLRWRGAVARHHIEVRFERDPRKVCSRNYGMTTIACTFQFASFERADGSFAMGAPLTIMPNPCDFSDEPFAKRACRALRVDMAAIKRGTSTNFLIPLLVVSCSFDKEIWGRLACHEIIGHQIGEWPASHPK